MNKVSHQSESPTDEFYGLLKQAFDHFNKELFDGILPNCLITVQREKNTMGYFSPNRWGNRAGKKAHEIAVNPAYFANHRVIEIFQTLVHEQCHMWQHVDITGKPSRSGYHNTQWAEKMESIGLMPSSTGDVGGKKTGQQMSDYPIPDGKFIQSCKRLINNGYQLSWVDRIPATSEPSQARVFEMEEPATEAEAVLETNISNIIPDIKPVVEVIKDKSPKSKVKYHCFGCGANLWGKPNLKIICGESACNNSEFREIQSVQEDS